MTVGMRGGWRELRNSDELLHELRTTRRVRAHGFANHPLIRTARRELHVPIYFFNNKLKRIDFGDAPNDTFYNRGSIYSGKFGQEEINSIWHDLCHAMVAKQQGKLGFDNFDSTDLDEDQSCRIEFWLGFATGYYSIQYLTNLIFEYSYSEDIVYEYECDGDESDFIRMPKYRWVVINSLLDFLSDSRLKAVENPSARRISKRLGVYSVKHLNQIFKAARV